MPPLNIDNRIAVIKNIDITLFVRYFFVFTGLHGFIIQLRLIDAKTAKYLQGFVTCTIIPYNEF